MTDESLDEPSDFPEMILDDETKAESERILSLKNYSPILKSKPEFFKLDVRGEYGTKPVMIDAVRIIVSGVDYIVSVLHGKRMWANKKPHVKKNPTGYDKGLVNCPTCYGALGENALAQLLGLPFDSEVVNGGKKADFIIQGHPSDLKTGVKNPLKANPKNRYKGLITAEGENREKYPVNEYYFFAYVEEKDHDKREAKVVIVGYIAFKDMSKETYLSQFKKSKHRNYEVPYKDLKSIKDLYFDQQRHLE